MKVSFNVKKAALKGRHNDNAWETTATCIGQMEDIKATTIIH